MPVVEIRVLLQVIPELRLVFRDRQFLPDLVDPAAPLRCKAFGLIRDLLLPGHV